METIRPRLACGTSAPRPKSPASWDAGSTVFAREHALAEVPRQTREVPGAWVGYIPAPEQYERIHRQALQKGIRLLNTPDEHLRAEEFDRAYPRLEGLTPDSVVLRDPA